MRILFIFIFISLSSVSHLQAQNQTIKANEDSVFIKKGYQLLLKDSALIIHKDTIIVIPAHTKYKIKKKPDIKTNEFYANLEQKS